MVDHPQVRLNLPTIAAVATPPGRGGVGVVRISGDRALAVGLALAGRRALEPRYCHLATFRDGEGQALDQGLVVYFPGPRSYTGEDVVELHGHGGPAILEGILEAAFALGATPAGPGEFSRRAYLNDRLDLSQAEAVAAMIDAESRAGARAALRSLEGELGRLVGELGDELTRLRVYVEGALDFPEDEVDVLGEGRVAQRLEALGERVVRLRCRADSGVRLIEGFLVVLAGRPNAGKSSLLNHLAGREAAIVTARAGTTRDVLRERVSLDGIPVELVDTAGLREAGDEVEMEGVRRVREILERADLVIYLADCQWGWTEGDDTEWQGLPSDRRLRVWSKADLGRPGEDPAISLVAPPGVAGLHEALRERLVAGYGSDAIGARQRHIEVLDRVSGHLAAASRTLEEHGSGDLMAQDLRWAQEALGEIAGRVHSDDLLGQVFATFCVGK